MIAPQGIATFPGVAQLLSASIQLGHGISPSTAVLTIVPQLGLSTESGTLSFQWPGVTIDFPDCKVNYASVERHDNGEIWRLSLFDRRWRWRFGQMSGRYNVWRDNFTLQRGENGTINTERTPQQLAALCLDAMGETGYDVSDLPNVTRPAVEWDGVVPAEALAALCDELGCRVVLQLDNRVAIRRAGVGAELSAAGALQYSTTVDPPERPDTIAVVCGPTRFQVDFPLEAVGLEEGDAISADTLKPIDLLSYKPTGGWSRADLPFFHQVAAALRPLAMRSVFRYYRIKTPVVVPGYSGPNGNKADSLEQLLPIEDEQVELATENGQPANLPAAVFGVWFPDKGDMSNSATTLKPAPRPLQTDGGASLSSIYQGPFTIDRARGLVIFEELVYRNTHASASGGSGYEVVAAPAQLMLRAACSVRDPQSQAAARYVRARATGGQLGTDARYLRHEEIALASVPSYSDTYTLSGVSTNSTDVDAAADNYLDAAVAEYQTLVPQTVRYPGLVLIELDGAIQHVGFEVGPGGATTTVSRNNEFQRVVLSYAERRRLEIQNEEAERKKQQSSRTLAGRLKADSRNERRRNP